MAEGKSYVWGTGRRKTAVARVRLIAGTGAIHVSEKDDEAYFPTKDQRVAVQQPLVACEAAGKFDVHVVVHGGGPQGQADAVRHGLASASSVFTSARASPWRTASACAR